MSRPSASFVRRAEDFDIDASGIATIGVVVVADDGRLVAANPAFSSFLGFADDELLGKGLPELLVHKKDWRDWRAAAKRGRAVDFEVELAGRDGHSVFARGTVEDLSSGARERCSRGIFVDVTSERRVRGIAANVARTEAVSSLVAGVAHDFNNLLTVLVGNLYLVGESVRGSPPTYEKFKRARDAAKRGSDLARALLGFSRGGDPEPGSVDVTEVVRNLTPLLRSALGSKVTLRSELPPEDCVVEVNQAQLESAITNLAINARDALEESASGSVTITVRPHTVSEPQKRPVELGIGRYVEIAVRDDGCGMPEHVARRVFEPFFTTKSAGRGSGLGLPMVRWFAQQAGGAAHVVTRPKKGTTVTCVLPASGKDLGESTVRTMPLSKLPGGTENVLVCSHDAEFTVTIEQILSALGYRVSCHEWAEPPLAQGMYALVVVDGSASCTLGSGSGSGLGGAGIVVIGDGGPRLPSGAVRLAKPFTLLELSRGLRRALEGT